MDQDTFTLLVKDMNDLRADINDLRKEIKSLNAFKWRVYGMAGFISFGLSVLINYLQ